MAQLIRSGDFVGSGEQLTAARLEAELPGRWVVIANKVLVGRDSSTREIDLIVVAEHTIFLIDEKHWHGTIRGDDKGWVLAGGDSQRSPITKMEMSARQLAGSLRRNVSRLSDSVGDRPFVEARVILSADDVACRVVDPRVERQVLKLEGATDQLRFDDRTRDPKASIEPFREQILQELTRLRDRPRVPSKVADYDVLEIVQDRGASMTLLARHSDGSDRVLQLIERRVTELPALAEQDKRTKLREYDALRRLSELDRAPAVAPYFSWREDEYWVVPMEVVPGSSLRSLFVSDGPPDTDLARKVASDAFEALADVHEAGILHRNLSPDTIYVDGDAHVRFVDFSLARVPDAASLGGNVEPISADGFVAPEVRLGFGFAEVRSDVYTLAATLLYWLTGIEPPVDQPWVAEPALRAAAEAVLGPDAADLLGRCLVVDERNRPVASEAAGILAGVVATLPDATAGEAPPEPLGPPEIGAEVEGRYRIESILGQGPMGITYLAHDALVDRPVVLKTLLNPEYVRGLAANEFNMLAGLTHPGLQRVFDVRPPEAPFHLKLEFVAGRTVTAFLGAGGRQPEVAERIAREIGDVLRYLEERGLVHRDISAGNVLIPDELGRSAVLLDFGLAGPTASITAVGTGRYRDPVVERGEPWTPAADRYSLGVLAFELAIGRLPYDTSGPTPDKTLIVELDEEERDRLAPYLAIALRRAVEPDPQHRFSSAAEFVAAFVPPPEPPPFMEPPGLGQKGGSERTVVANRFVIVPDSMVTGGVSDVFRAVDLEDPARPVALKLIRDTPEQSRLSDLFFEREVGSLRELRHENIVELVAGGKDPETSRYYLALEWVPQTLVQFLDRREDVGWEWFSQAVGLPLARALAAAHERQIIHRDVKPSNVLVTPEGSVKLADFGISVLKTRLADTSRTLAQYGSAPYAPPESETVSDAARDTFGFGVLAIEAMARHKLGDYGDIAPALESLDIPERAYELLRSCIALDPTERPLNGLILEARLAEASRPEAVEGETRGSDIYCVVVSPYLEEQATTAALRLGLGSGSDFIHRDLADGVFVRRAPIQPDDVETHLFLFGRLWSFRAKVQASPPELLLIGGRPEPADKLDRERERSVYVSSTFRVGVPITNYVAADAALTELLDRIDVLEGQQRDDAAEREDRRVFAQWAAQLRASEELEMSRENALAYRGARRDGNVVTCMLDEELDEDIAGQERLLRAVDGRGKRFPGVVGELRGRTVEFWLEPGLEGDPPTTGVLAFDSGPSTISLKRRRDALNTVRYKGASLRRSDLPALLLHPEDASQASETPVARWMQADLDEDKRLAVSRALGCRDFMLVQGPPGTGKTTLIAELVAQELRRNPDVRILLTSQTHVALDNALEILERVIPTARVTRLATSEALVAEDVRHLLLERQAPGWRREIRRRSERFLEAYANEQELNTEAVKAALLLGRLRGLRMAHDEAADALASTYKALADAEADPDDSDPAAIEVIRAELASSERRISDLDRDIGNVASDLAPLLKLPKSDVSKLTGARIDDAYREQLPVESDASKALAGLIVLQGEWLERVGRGAEFDQALLRSSHIVAATCVGLAGFYAAQDLAFDLCILDEASKAMATDSLVPFVRSLRWVLVGDQQQLPPFQEHALMDPTLQANYGLDPAELDRTLFDLLWSGLPEANKINLRQQHRMISPIGDLISDVFYGGMLVSRRTPGLDGFELALPKPVTWFDTSAEPDHQERRAGAGHTSFENPAEARFAITFLRRLSGVLQWTGRTDPMSILVLAAYLPQVYRLRELVAANADALSGLRIEVLTVDAAQGREADMVAFSVTRSNEDGTPGFLSDRRRINVALSRPKFGLAIIGDATFCGSQQGPLRAVLAHIRDNPDDCAVKLVGDE